MNRETGELSAGSLTGNKLYEQRARRALPILVRQATAGNTMLYSALAEELEMPNPRNLNYVLGAVGNGMLDLGEKWDEKVPPIQALVVNKNSGMPGLGISWFAPDASDFKRASSKNKKQIVDAMLLEVYGYKKWEQVLQAFELSVMPAPISLVSSDKPKTGSWGGGGEGEAHRILKDAISANPQLVGLPSSFAPGQMEVSLRSGDCVDVVFENKQQKIAVEVKGCGASESEVVRGIFQCVKYAAVLEAEASAKQNVMECKALLALGDAIPGRVISLKNTLGINVCDNIG